MLAAAIILFVSAVGLLVEFAVSTNWPALALCIPTILLCADMLMSVDE